MDKGFVAKPPKCFFLKPLSPTTPDIFPLEKVRSSLFRIHCPGNHTGSLHSIKMIITYIFLTQREGFIVTFIFQVHDIPKRRSAAIQPHLNGFIHANQFKPSATGPKKPVKGIKTHQFAGVMFHSSKHTRLRPKVTIVVNTWKPFLKKYQKRLHFIPDWYTGSEQGNKALFPSVYCYDSSAPNLFIVPTAVIDSTNWDSNSADSSISLRSIFLLS